MADVYRLGARDVHRANRLPNGKDETVIDCNLDRGTEWGPAIPAGPRCSVCFAGYDKRKRNRRLATAGGSAGVLALVAAVVAGGADGDPVSSFVVVGASGSFLTASASGDLVSFTPSASPVLVTPGPSSVSPDPTATPALTPRPTTFEPTPTDRMIPSNPHPEPTCVHPGRHLGTDACKWPGNDR